MKNIITIHIIQIMEKRICKRYLSLIRLLD